MSWTHDQVEAQLSDYLDGLLQPSDQAAFQEHVDDCAQCNLLLGSVSNLLAGMHTLEPLEAPPRLIYAILDSTLGPRETVSAWQSVKNFVRGFASPKFAYGSASVMATAMILISATGFSLRKPKLADLRPANVYRSADRQAHLAYARSVKYVSDLRVVYEIQSRLRSDQNDLQSSPDESLPKPAPDKNPGQTDEQKPAQPRQQNRANEVAQRLEMMAAQCPVLYERSF